MGDMIAKYSLFEDISRELTMRGLDYQKWSVLDSHHNLPDGQILSHYKSEIDAIMQQHNFKTVDIVSMTPSNPNKATFRDKLLDEHSHSETEVRFFVDGAAAFYIHLVERAEIVRIEC